MADSVMNPKMNPDLSNPELLAALDAKRQAVVETLGLACELLPSVSFASSLGAEDMVLTEIILKAHLPIRIFSLDTGRLPPETYDLIGEIERHYGHRIELYLPEREAVEAYVRKFGVNGFYASLEARHACCGLRKLEPLRRALAGQAAWITGQRAAQSITRARLPIREWDAEHGLEKLNPLADWSEREVWGFIRLHRVPYNRLHDRGYPSIGCAPCTRAISVGEDVRAGRWWWEDAGNRECGLHRQTPAVSH
ncbi:phosphoadenylylsulfate reductase (thioredoxin) [Thiobaca trueperi]|uniref:Adenosine 5'-phosphosulfate reductase n=2 Tax=Thiobaca trueperi TaxID=127458 RepID=A0A4R3N5U1_9GAMM|nr:phosphoadenylylsulfate reductase (thioredoxin) [Thiobaca trueperi]